MTDADRPRPAVAQVISLSNQEQTMSPHITTLRHIHIAGSLPGPSRTITVEPVRIPASPREVPRTEPAHEPERREPDPKREPVPSR
jgi:hypothetical protein